MDPRAELQAATERNAREACVERERAEKEKPDAAKAAQEKADAAAEAQADAAAKAQADAAAKAQAKEAAHGRTPQLIMPLRSAPPAPEIPTMTGGVDDEQPVMERGGDVVVLGAEMPPQAPTAEAQSSRPDVPPVPPVDGELVVRATPVVRTLARRRAKKAASAPRPQEVRAASSSAPNAEATSRTPLEWMPRGGMAILNTAAQEVRALLQAQGAALQEYTKAFVATRTIVRDYHNIRAAAFNSHIQELAKRNADLVESRSANATLWQQLGEAQTTLRAKEAECSKAAEERDRLVKELADQADRHKAALQKAKDNETGLLAEFETERSNGGEEKRALTDGFSEIEDMIDKFFPGYSVAANQAIKERREERGNEGVEIMPNAPRTFNERLLAIQSRLQPAHRMLRRLQHVGAQVLSALWPETNIPRTPRRTADWLEVVVGRLEAWKGSSAQVGARRALEFVKARYPGLDLDQQATFRQEAAGELAAVAAKLTQRAAAIAEYTNTEDLIPELDEEGAKLPANWFGLNPADGEDSMEEITSSDEGEGEESADGEDDAPEDGADDQPQLDRASSSEPRAGASAAARDDQAEIHQPATPPAGAADSTSLPDSPVAPLA
nr:uncharacterized protein LOC109787149 [Aegilops tauschii subsp. strangulata]